MATSVAVALIHSRLDYANSLLYGISASNILRLQRCQNAAARLVLQQSSTLSVHDIMDRLHWLPIRARIDFKIATLTYNTLTFGHPAYLRELISPYQPSRLLRSGKQLLLTVPRDKLAIGQRAFSYSSNVIWNEMLEMLRPLAHSNHSILTHSFPNLNIRHLATARASDSSYLCLTMLRVINFCMYVCMYVCITV